ncbi:MAG: hypothetical protein Ct9H300mP22_4300 [Gammaproteobacteria bacterium]|nr:MAG: hypothetical protein Ct9H300mP22_4300 [Gammaproteobacteria bacterium]
MGAKEAKSLGIVNEVFPDQETMLKAVMAIAKEITSKAPLAIYGSKRIINYAAIIVLLIRLIISEFGMPACCSKMK